MTSWIDLTISSLLGFLHIYVICLIVRLTLTWFPHVNWYGQPFCSMSRLADPYLRVFRKIGPPIFGLDLSPILGFTLLHYIIQILSNVKAIG